MSDVQISAEIESRVEIPPTENLNHALGANHDIRTGLAELIDNSIDAGATKVAIVFQVEDMKLVQVSIHDDGVGMDDARMLEVLRLGGHAAHSTKNIGRYGMGMKEGSFANAETVTVVSRKRGMPHVGYQLSKANFTAGKLSEQSLTRIWNLRNDIVPLKHGTSIIWNDLTTTYRGKSEDEARQFLSTTLETIRKFVGIRYHRFLEDGRIKILFYSRYDMGITVANPEPKPIDPFSYQKSGAKGYPRRLAVKGMPGTMGVTVHIWPNRSDRPGFHLEAKDELGHQGFYIYDADRLITAGDWSGFRIPKKETKLLRVLIDDPSVIERFVTVSPQKGAVRLNESFHRFITSLHAKGAPSQNFEAACRDAAETLRESNRKSGKAAPLAEAGRGLAPAIKKTVEDYATLKNSEPVDVVWGPVKNGDFVAVDFKRSQVIINQDYRQELVKGRGSLNDAPLLKALLYLLFNEPATKKATGKMTSNVELWTQILNAAIQEQIAQDGRLF